MARGNRSVKCGSRWQKLTVCYGGKVNRAKGQSLEGSNGRKGRPCCGLRGAGAGFGRSDGRTRPQQQGGRARQGRRGVVGFVSSPAASGSSGAGGARGRPPWVGAGSRCRGGSRGSAEWRVDVGSALALPGRLGSPGGAWLDHDKLRGSWSPIRLREPLSC